MTYDLKTQVSESNDSSIIVVNFKVKKSHNACLLFNIWESVTLKSGPDSSVGIATGYELDGPGSNPGGDEMFRPSSLVLGPTQPPVQWVPGFSRG